MKAVGFVETKGLIGLVAATDAMPKAANVQVVKRVEIGGGLVTAIEAGPPVASQVGELVSSHLIATPFDGVIEAFLAEHARSLRNKRRVG